MNITCTENPRLAPNVTMIAPLFDRIRQDLKDDVQQEKLKVAAYARVSTEQDEQESSYEAQVDYYTRYIKTHDDWELAGIFADRGITGTSTKNRDEFNKMIDAAMSGQIDLILTKSISRFARNTVDTLQTVRKLKEVGVEVIFEKENIHSLDPKCEMILTIMSSLAQEESRSISENVRWGKKRSMESGNVYMPYYHFLGYRKGEDGRPEIVEEEAAIVREIYNSFLAGKSISQIAEDLTARGITTPGGKTKWRISTVRSILSNEKYKGEAILQKTFSKDYLSKKVCKNNGELPQYNVTNSHEPIIQPDLFDRVQRELKRRRSARPKKAGMDSPLANRLVCADCGGFYGHKVWRSGGRSGIRYDVWYCNHRYNGEEKCKTPTLREEEIRDAFVKALKNLNYPEPEYSDKLWRELVESVKISADREAEFLLTNGKVISQKL